MTPPLLARLDARDRALFHRVALDARCARLTRDSWRVITHLGGARASIGACLLSLLLPTVTIGIAWRALLLLGSSHLLVQVVKRLAGRERPTPRTAACSLVDVPDRFSFPSGHACASMAVAVAYAWAFPALAVPLLALALVVGSSRVVLGVHYPGDVAVGQAIALVSGYVMFALGDWSLLWPLL
jgi:undecaprenyl-diphosphatase